MFAKTKHRERHGKKNSRTGACGALAALALAGALGMAVLGTPAAASAGTATLGPGGISLNRDLVEWPHDGGLIGSGPLTGCEVLVGDHWRSDVRAAGEGEVSCNVRHYFSMKVYLDYRTSPSGALYTATSASASWTGRAGLWWYLPTNGTCQPGGPATRYYWTTYVEISVDGSAWQRWYISRQNAPYTIPAC